MPELPEVENIVRTLREPLEGRILLDASVRTPSIVGGREGFGEALRGRRILALERRGKYILLRMDRGWLLIHLRMTGRLLLDGEEDRHTHVIFTLDDGSTLLYKDVRKFGRVLLFEDQKEMDAHLAARLGLEPGEMSYPEFRERMGRTRGAAKKVLLDQKIVAGIGNIYADEILHRCGIHPLAKVERMKEKDLKGLYAAIREILERAIAGGGSTIRDYVNSNGAAGGFQKDHQVYGRSGRECTGCGTILEKTKVAGRTTVHCPRCQKRRKER